MLNHLLPRNPMQFLNLLTNTSRWPRPSLETVLEDERVRLRAGDPADWRVWSALREQSRNYLQPWEPLWSTDALTYEHFCGNLRRQWREWREGKGYAFLIFAKAAGAEVHPAVPSSQPVTLVGGITLNDVQRGIAQKGTLGYWIGQPYANQGLMTAATRLVCDFAFKALLLNRVEASCLPHNEPSKRLLEKVGFTLEGRAAGYLKINGKWEDHLLWGRTAN